MNRSKRLGTKVEGAEQQEVVLQKVKEERLRKY